MYPRFFRTGCFYGTQWLIPLLVLLFIGLVVWLLVSKRNTSSNSQEILKKRLANGEITVEEYEKLKKIL